jgi:hypothetical protein
VNCFFTELAIINYTSACWSSKIQGQILSSHQKVTLHDKGRKVFDYFYCPRDSCNLICGVNVSVINLCALDLRFEPRSSQIDDSKTGVCFFSAKKTSLRNEGIYCWLGIRIMYKSSLLKPLGKMNRILTGSMYGRSPIKHGHMFYQSHTVRKTKLRSIKM